MVSLAITQPHAVISCLCDMQDDGLAKVIESENKARAVDDAVEDEVRRLRAQHYSHVNPAEIQETRPLTNEASVAVSAGLAVSSARGSNHPFLDQWSEAENLSMQNVTQLQAHSEAAKAGIVLSPLPGLTRMSYHGTVHAPTDTRQGDADGDISAVFSNIALPSGTTLESFIA